MENHHDFPHYVHHLGLILRNSLVAVATVMFLLSIILHGHSWLKVVGYILGMLAYICEYLHLTKFFRVKIPHDEAFMVYCFAPLYLLLGLSYLFH